jgi:hypothetical protein
MYWPVMFEEGHTFLVVREYLRTDDTNKKKINAWIDIYIFF